MSLSLITCIPWNQPLLGVQVSIFGSVPLLANPYNMTATSSYVLDDLDPINFTAPVYHTDQFHQNFYTSPLVLVGQHTITATAVSVNSEAVFWLDYIQYIPAPDTTTSSAGTVTITTTQSPSAASDVVQSHGNKLSVILPATLVPIFVLLVVVTVLVCLTHRRKKAKAPTYPDPPNAYSVHFSEPRRRKREILFCPRTPQI